MYDEGLCRESEVEAKKTARAGTLKRSDGWNRREEEVNFGAGKKRILAERTWIRTHEFGILGAEYPSWVHQY